MHLHTCHLSILNIQLNMRNLLEKASPNWQIQCVLRKPLITVTHQSPLHTAEIPVSKGIHYVEQIRHSNRTTSTGTLPDEDLCPTLGANCHKGVICWTIKSFICAQGTSLQMTETTKIELSFHIYSATLI